jgi:phosphatidylserine/phosphatidylglycerophosphate/cardiolipin synthase-like enzyme
MLDKMKRSASKITNKKTFAVNYQVLSPNEFINDFEREAAQAKNRIWTQAMYVEGGQIFNRLEALLISAASKNLDVRLHADWFSLKFSDEKYMRTGSERFKNKLGMFDSLKKNGVKLLFTNTPTKLEHVFPYKGRNHMKMTIVDSIAYLGGVNYADADFKFDDFMVKFTEKDIVDAIQNLFLNVEAGTLTDKKIQINKETALIIDGGKPGKSIILKEAIRAAKSAKISISHTCQFIPDGAFLRALHKAYSHNLQVNVISPDKNSFSRMLSGIYNLNRVAIALKRQTIPVYLLNNMVHAKLTVVDESYILMGSHNLSLSGVRVGTAEVALASTNSQLVHNLDTYFKQLLTTTKKQYSSNL